MIPARKSPTTRAPALLAPLPRLRVTGGRKRKLRASNARANVLKNLFTPSTRILPFLASLLCMRLCLPASYIGYKGMFQVRLGRMSLNKIEIGSDERIIRLIM